MVRVFGKMGKNGFRLGGIAELEAQIFNNVLWQTLLLAVVYLSFIPEFKSATHIIFFAGILKLRWGYTF